MSIFGRGIRKTYDGKNGVKITKTAQQPLNTTLNALADLEVLVGYPEDGSARKAGEDGKSAELTNAALAYIHDNGAPEQNIPARPFMLPGIESVQRELDSKLKQIGRAAMRDQPPPNVVEVGLTQVGLIAQKGIQKYINAGVDPPLSDRTLQARARRKRGSKSAKLDLAARAAGVDPGVSLSKPLIDTTQMRDAVTFVIRSRKRRK
jgi:hypothetical protein